MLEHKDFHNGSLYILIGYNRNLHPSNEVQISMNLMILDFGKVIATDYGLARLNSRIEESDL